MVILGVVSYRVCGYIGVGRYRVCGCIVGWKVQGQW